MITQRRADFSNVFLYAVTGEFTDEKYFFTKAEGLLLGGVDVLQLRTKTLSDRGMIEAGRRLKKLCDGFGSLLIVNDRVDVALAVNADGVHLGQDNMPIPMAREILGHRMIIGASTHSLPQAIEAQKHGADYVSCGPLWATPTKPKYEAVGLKLVGLYRATLDIPFVAIGGIDETNLNDVLRAGARTVAMVRALFDDPKPLEKARRLKNQILESVQTSIAV